MRILILLSLVFWGVVARAETVVVATETWELYTEQDGSGLYLDIVRTALAAQDVDIEIVYVPYARAVSLVMEGQADIVLAVYLDDYGSSLLYSSSVISTDRVDAVISPELDEQWVGAQTLTGKRVVAQTDFRFDQYFDFEMVYSEVSDVENMLKMLAYGRVDAVLDYETTVSQHWANSGLTPDFKIKRGLLKSNIHFAFTPNARGFKWKSAFDRGFQKAAAAGEIESLYLKYLGHLDSYPSFE